MDFLSIIQILKKGIERVPNLPIPSRGTFPVLHSDFHYLDTGSFYLWKNNPTNQERKCLCHDAIFIILQIILYERINKHVAKSQHFT